MDKTQQEWWGYWARRRILRSQTRTAKRRARECCEAEIRDRLRGDFKTGVQCLFCEKPIEKEEESLKSHPRFTDKIGWVHKTCLSQRDNKPIVRIPSQPRPKYPPKLPSENPKKAGAYKRRQRGE